MMQQEKELADYAFSKSSDSLIKIFRSSEEIEMDYNDSKRLD